VDEFTRECLAIRVARRLTSEDVLQHLTASFVVFGVCPATTCRGQEEPWHPASVAVRPESGCKEPEIACQVAPTTAIHRPAGAFAPCIWRMAAY
jgi:hypothetical protein